MPELRQRMEQLPDARAEQCMEQLLDARARTDRANDEIV